MAEMEVWFETASESGEDNSTEGENERVTVAKKKRKQEK
jgi:hypothetical protein